MPLTFVVRIKKKSFHFFPIKARLVKDEFSSLYTCYEYKKDINCKREKERER